jgi:ribose 5-phosphate isomerase B
MSEQRYRMAVGSDDAGVHLKDYIRDRLQEDPRVVEVRDFGVADASDTTPYPVVCIKVAEAVARREFDRAVLFGGTGLGEAISANKVRGIRAVVAIDPFSIERSILSNNCQILALGERGSWPTGSVHVRPVVPVGGQGAGAHRLRGTRQPATLALTGDLVWDPRAGRLGDETTTGTSRRWWPCRRGNRSHRCCGTRAHVR